MAASGVIDASGATTWHGDQVEWAALVEVVARHCACGENAPAAEMCAAHRMLREQQRALDGLLFARRIVERLNREEWHPKVGLNAAEAE